MTEAPDVPDAPVDLAPTGDPRVDAVLGSLEDLQGRPVSEHAAVFEQAHERFREALDPDGAGREAG